MATAYQRPDRGTWECRYRDRFGKQQRFRCANKTHARQMAADYTALELRWQAGEDVPDPRDKGALERRRRLEQMTVAELAEEWLAVYNPGAPSTVAKRASAVRAWVTPLIGDVPVGQVRPGHVRKVIATIRDKGRKPATQELAYRTIDLLMQHAVEQGMRADNPCASVSLPKGYAKTQRTIRPFTADEFDRLLRHLDTDDRLLVRFWRAVGVRPNEMFSLNVDDIDAQAGVVRVYDRKTRRRRPVPVPAGVLADVLAHVGGRESGPLWVNAHGGRQQPQNWRRRHWQPAVDAAGMGERVPYDLRHTYASHLIAAGIDVRRVAEVMGNSSRIVLQHYAHLFPGHDDALSSAVSGLDSSDRPVLKAVG